MDRNLIVAFDGSWQKRGHTSLNGIVSATSVDTVNIIDIAIMYKHWKCKGVLGNKHEESCSSNYDGSSGGMEVPGVKEIFERSLSLYNITKLECVGHVQKRMDSRLRRLTTSKKGKKLNDGRTLDGKNRLTDSTIDIIQNYYGLAIRQNTDSVEKMRTTVWALFCHISSIDDKQTATCIMSRRRRIMAYAKEYKPAAKAEGSWVTAINEGPFLVSWLLYYEWPFDLLSIQHSHTMATTGGYYVKWPRKWRCDTRLSGKQKLGKDMKSDQLRSNYCIRQVSGRVSSLVLRSVCFISPFRPVFPVSSATPFNLFLAQRHTQITAGHTRRAAARLQYARLHHRGSKLDPRSDLRSTQKTVAAFEFRAGLEIKMKFISNR
ncbi:hypothetical protein PR048_003628 [Dryococelus australis]|uniref:Mutator-like transposase domain-containing protein n=1 Tax=Dryococelus australis TaxID=614101 RepID=A0ABQ9IQF6_9NEOP|nr:hypothetical protein PR048_003628 [Dryococelus australis]